MAKKTGHLTLIASLATLAGCAAPGWRAQQIDGSSPAKFEESVGSLQERLTPRRRAEFETSLAIIWIRDTTEGAGDRDSDGRVDVNEVRALQQLAEDVLTDIRRGFFAYAVSERDATGAGYIERLNGLRYSDVIDLAAATNGDVFLHAVRRQRAEGQCDGLRARPGSSNVTVSDPIKSAVLSRFCARR